MAYSPDGFARALRGMANAVQGQQGEALRARAKITERGILAGAATVGGLGRKVNPSWVKTTYEGGSRDPVAKLRLAGGFAVLTQRGSYKKTSGWEITSKRTSRSRKAARRRARGPVDISSSSARGVIGSRASGFGPFVRVHHPALRPRPFFGLGVRTASGPAARAYSAVVFRTIERAIN